MLTIVPDLLARKVGMHALMIVRGAMRFVSIWARIWAMLRARYVSITSGMAIKKRSRLPQIFEYASQSIARVVDYYINTIVFDGLLNYRVSFWRGDVEGKPTTTFLLNFWECFFRFCNVSSDRYNIVASFECRKADVSAKAT